MKTPPELLKSVAAFQSRMLELASLLANASDGADVILMNPQSPKVLEWIDALEGSCDVAIGEFLEIKSHAQSIRASIDRMENQA
jgi:hypothetical protein